MKEHRTKEPTFFIFPATSYQGVKDIVGRVCETKRLFVGM